MCRMSFENVFLYFFVVFLNFICICFSLLERMYVANPLLVPLALIDVLCIYTFVDCLRRWRRAKAINRRVEEYVFTLEHTATQPDCITGNKKLDILLAHHKSRLPHLEADIDRELLAELEDKKSWDLIAFVGNFLELQNSDDYVKIKLDYGRVLSLQVTYQIPNQVTQALEADKCGFLSGIAEKCCGVMWHYKVKIEETETSTLYAWL